MEEGKEEEERRQDQYNHLLIINYNKEKKERKKKEKFKKFRGKLLPKPKLNTFCALYQNHQHFFLKNNLSILKQLFLKLKNGIKILVGHMVL